MKRQPHAIHKLCTRLPLRSICICPGKWWWWWWVVWELWWWWLYEWSLHKPAQTDQQSEIGDAREGLTDDKFEGDGGEEENEGKLQSVLQLHQVHTEGWKSKRADKQLWGCEVICCFIGALVVVTSLKLEVSSAHNHYKSIHVKWWWWRDTMVVVEGYNGVGFQPWLRRCSKRRNQAFWWLCITIKIRTNNNIRYFYCYFWRHYLPTRGSEGRMFSFGDLVGLWGWVESDRGGGGFEGSRGMVMCKVVYISHESISPIKHMGWPFSTYLVHVT